MLEEFLTWWREQLLDLLPARWRSGGGPPADALVIVLRTPLVADTPLVELVRRRRGSERALGVFRLDREGGVKFGEALQRQRGRARLTLRLPPGAMLQRRVLLPLLAEREPEQVLSYEMDRFTPFRSDELYWTWSVAQRDRVRGQLHMLLAFVPQASLTPVLAVLRRHGGEVAMLEPDRADAPAGGAIRHIALQRPAAAGGRWQRRGLAAAGFACGLLAIVAVALPFLQQTSAMAAVERRIAGLQPQVAEVERLRREAAARIAGTDVVAAERARVGDVLQVLAALTDLLPDESFLTEFSLRQGRLNLTGQSAAAARLIAAFSADRVIRNPAFAAPVTRTGNGQADLFSIRAEVTP